jgi:hypothetical protein
MAGVFDGRGEPRKWCGRFIEGDPELPGTAGEGSLYLGALRI